MNSYRLFPVIQKNVIAKIIPFAIDVAENAHHIPVSPMIPPRMIANGILALVNAILITLQRRVFPRPDSAPIVVSSTHIKASLNPMMIRYPIAIETAFGSWKKISAIGSGNIINTAVIRYLLSREPPDILFLHVPSLLLHSSEP